MISCYNDTTSVVYMSLFFTPTRPRLFFHARIFVGRRFVRRKLVIITVDKKIFQSLINFLVTYVMLLVIGSFDSIITLQINEFHIDFVLCEISILILISFLKAEDLG